MMGRNAFQAGGGRQLTAVSDLVERGVHVVRIGPDLAFGHRLVLGPGAVEQAQGKKGHSADDAEHRSRGHGGSQIFCGHHIGELRCAGQGGHGVGGRTHNQAGHGQVTGQIRLFEQQKHDGGHSIHHHEQTHAAVGQYGDNEDAHQHDILSAEPVNELVPNGGGAAGLIHQLGVQSGAGEHEKVAHVGAGITCHVMGGKTFPQRDAVEHNGHQCGNQGQGQSPQTLVCAENQDCDGQQQANDSNRRHGVIRSF